MRIYIHTNNKQLVGALVAKSIWFNKGFNDVKILNIDESKILSKIWGQTYKRGGHDAQFIEQDLQSFTLSRFQPEVLGVFPYLVTDPDVFPVSENLTKHFDELISESWDGLYAVKYDKGHHSSVMLRTGNSNPMWSFEALINDLLSHKLDYNEVMLLDFIKSRVKPLSKEFNSFDRLTKETLLLHNTGRITQPWKEGLPIDFINHKVQKKGKPKSIKALIKQLVKRPKPQTYIRHPDVNQIDFFFKALKTALNQDFVSEEILKQQIKLKHIRPDIFNVLERY